MYVISPWFSDFQSADQEHTIQVTCSPPQSHHPLCSVDRATAPVLQHIFYPSYTALQIPVKLPAVVTSKIRKSTSTKLTYAHDTWHIHTYTYIHVFLFGTEHPQVTSAKFFFFLYTKPDARIRSFAGHHRYHDKMTKREFSSTCPHSIRTHTNGSGIFDTIALLSSYFFLSGQSNKNKISRLAVSIDHRERERFYSVNPYICTKIKCHWLH